MLSPPQKPVAIKFSNSVFFGDLKEIAAESVNAPIILHISTERKLSEITQSATDLASAPNARRKPLQASALRVLPARNFFRKKT